PQMAEIVIQMVKNGVIAYINHDLELARSLDKTDDRVDTLFNTVMSDLTALIKKNADNAEQAIMFMMITKYLERIGDHAVNIGEWVEYSITGEHPKGKNSNKEDDEQNDKQD
ncbi:MAG: phosphate transport system regulatory protein PhoU, partial [Oscillospiraceae bacterium]|nr:phosphate transport system regulatory protein PhoU [Oscillospiraceae bacterium]